MSLSFRSILRGALALAVVGSGLTAVTALALDTGAPPHYLVFTATYGFRHDGIQEAVAVLQKMANDTDKFTLEVSGDASLPSPVVCTRMTPSTLRYVAGESALGSPVTSTVNLLVSAVCRWISAAASWMPSWRNP